MKTLHELAKQVGLILKNENLILATAESCTAGGLSYWLTSVPGSSAWFERGFVTYSDIAKVEMLNVSAETIETHGAVSEQVVREMAAGALFNSQANLSIAITGIAGPTGGTDTKPVGTVWIAWAQRDAYIYVSGNVFTGNREEIRLAAIQKALRELISIMDKTL